MCCSVLGTIPAPAGASDIPGLEVAGTIVAGDAQAMHAAGLAMGDRVCALVAGGGYAEYVRGAGRPVPAGARRVERYRSGFLARDGVHRVEQCV